MKKLSICLLTVLLLLTLGSCKQEEPSVSLPIEETQETQEKKEEVIEEVKQEEVSEEVKEEPKKETKEEIDPEVLKTYKYWVVFYNPDGTELQREALKWGTTPKYYNETPYYYDGSYDYDFVGWTNKKGKPKELKPITGNTYFYAKYEISTGRTNGGGGSNPPAPDPEYEQLTCLTTGDGITKAYINTKVTSSKDMRFEVKAKIKSGVWSYVFGHYNGGGIALAGFYNDGSAYGYDLYFGEEEVVSPSNEGKDQESTYEFQVKDNNSYLKINGVTVKSVSKTVNLTPDDIYLFAIKPLTVQNAQTGCTIYYMKIYQNGVLVRDYIPVKTIKVIDKSKNANDNTTDIPVGELCMYDKANDMYYLNLGSTPFTDAPVN